MWIHTFNLDVYGIGSQSTGVAYAVYCIEAYWTKLTNIAVPMFFLISGFLFFRTYLIENALAKYKTRVKTIVIPYLCWCTIYYLYYVVLSNIPFIKNMLSEADFVELSLTGWVKSLWIDSYYTLWFLKNLIIFIAVSPLIYFLLKSWKNKIPTGIIIIILICLNSHYNWIYMPNGIEWYLVGSWIAINHRDWALCKNMVCSLIAAGYIIFVLVTGFRFWNIFTQTAFYIAIWLALDIFKDFGEIPAWMKMSFFTYVAHDIFLESIEKVYLMFFGTNPIWALVDYAFMPAFVLVVLIIVANILKKISYPLWQVLVGYR